jgi:DNA-binding IclR family transcriptional regulator
VERAEAAGREFRPVTSVARTVRILEELGASRESQTLGALVRRVGIPKSTLHGILRTLEHHGWVETDATGLRFRIGPGSMRMGTAYADSDDVVQRLSPVLDRLAATTGETVQLARLSGSDVVYLAQRDSRHPVRLVSAVGGRLPAHATALGKALLAHYTAAEVDRRLPRRLERLTERTPSTREQLHAALADTRRRGWALDHEEVAEGLRCYAVALRISDPPVDALSISVPTFRVTEEREQLIVRSLLEASGAPGEGCAVREPTRPPVDTPPGSADRRP